MGKLSGVVRTRETYFEKIKNLSDSSIDSKRIAIQHFELFARKEYNIETCEEMIIELKKEKETILYDILQKWINGLILADPKVRFGHLNGYLYYHGIKIVPMDVRNNLTFKKVTKREQYPLKREQIVDIISPVKYHKKALYLALASSGMRIGEALRIRKRDLDFSQSRIKITIPAEIAKNGVSRYTWMVMRPESTT
jgi:integrase